MFLDLVPGKRQHLLLQADTKEGKFQTKELKSGKSNEQIMRSYMV